MVKENEKSRWGVVGVLVRVADIDEDGVRRGRDTGPLKERQRPDGKVIIGGARGHNEILRWAERKAETEGDGGTETEPEGINTGGEPFGNQAEICDHKGDSDWNLDDVA